MLLAILLLSSSFLSAQIFFWKTLNILVLSNIAVNIACLNPCQNEA